MLDNFFKKVYNILVKQREVITMENFENENYLETPLAKNLEEFKTYYEEDFRKTYSQNEVEIISDAFLVGISEMWVEKQILNGNNIGIYEKIILKCCELSVQASKQMDTAWEEQLKMLKSRYQITLFQTITAIIRDYCMEV